MKKRILAMLLALCMILPLGAGALAEGELNAYQLTEPEMAALIEALGGADPMAIGNGFFHIIMTYEQTSKSQAFTYADAIADVLAADGDGSAADSLASMFGIGDEAELEVVTAISDWLNEQQMDEARTAAFFQSLSDGMNWPTDAYEAFAEELFSGREAAPAEEDAASAEEAAPAEDGEEDVSAYHLTAEEAQAFADAMSGFDVEDVFHAFDHIRLTMDLFPTSYADAIADILDGGDGAAEKVASDFSIGTEAQLEVVAAVSDWIERQQIEQDRVEDFFWALFDVDDISQTFDALDKLLSGELLPAEGAAKTAEDTVTEQDLQELLTCIGKAVQDEYLTPNGVDPAALVWPTDPGTFRYFDVLFTNYCISALTGEPPKPVTDDYVPASPDKEIMDAVYAGVMNWLDGFESVDYEYLVTLGQEINNIEYVLEYLPANLTF